MRAMTVQAHGSLLVPQERPDPRPREGEVRLLVLACAVCRADVHIADGRLRPPHLPVVPGHEVVGMVDAVHPSVTQLRVGQRVGLTWMGSVCGRCAHCTSGRENLCEQALYTGFHRDGGFATHVVADAQFCFPLDQLEMSAVEMAPLLCGGITGWRALKLVGEGRSIGLFGFGASAQFVAQVAHQQGRRVFVFTRPGDTAMQGVGTVVGRELITGPVEHEAAIRYAVRIAAHGGAKEACVVQVSLDPVVAEDDVGGILSPRHSELLQDRPPGNDAHLHSVGIGQDDGFDRPPIGQRPERFAVRVGGNGRCGEGHQRKS